MPPIIQNAKKRHERNEDINGIKSVKYILFNWANCKNILNEFAKIA